VQIGTALLVKVRVFRYLVWIAYSLKCWTAWTVKVEAVICSEIWLLYTGQHGVISEGTLMLSRIAENTLECYRNAVMLIILKAIFSLSNLRALLHVNKTLTNVRYSHQYLPPNCQLYLQIFQQLPFTFRSQHFISISHYTQPTTHNSVLTPHSL